MGNKTRRNYIINDEMSHFNWTDLAKPKPIDKVFARTYMPGYDLGDWLTIKSDEQLYSVVQIVDITTEAPYHVGNGADNDLYIHIKRVVVKEHPRTLTTMDMKGFLRWNLYENGLAYSTLLKEYRPLTEAEKLFFVNEE